MFNKIKEYIKDRLKVWLDINRNHKYVLLSDEYVIKNFNEIIKINKKVQDQIDGILKSAELDRNHFTSSIKRIEEKLDERN